MPVMRQGFQESIISHPSSQTEIEGFKPSIRKQRYKIQTKDLVWLNDQMFSGVGIQNKGSCVKLKDCSKVMPVRNIEKSYNFGGLAWN